jgi:predicted nucleic acid-binding protein
MSVLIDTNVLLRSAQKSHPQCRVARQAMLVLARSSEVLYLATQNFAEFWNVGTRPKSANGLGLSIEETDGYLTKMETLFEVLPDSIEVFRLWRRLVVAHEVKGANVHDTRLVASMKAYKIQRILTFNHQDFNRFHEIEAIHPEELLRQP